MMRENNNQERLQFLSTQIQDQNRARDEWNRTKYGSIDGGFFDGFGKSHR
jgi:hypothetical protein